MSRFLIRDYHYEGSRSPILLAGIKSERDVRFSRVSMTNEGRATSSCVEMGGV